MIAIDGPVGSGKTTVGRLLAERLGFSCVDSGLFYRAAAWALLREGGSPDDKQAAIRAAQTLDLRFKPDASEQHAARAIQKEVDITDALYTPDVEQAVSQISRIPEVRRVLLATQRRAISQGGVVALGRDIGTVVWPEATLKIYLDASLEARVQRKLRQRRDLGEDVDVATVRALLENRDSLDSGRSVAPLRKAADAVAVDTDDVSAEEVAARIATMLRDRLNANVGEA